MFFSQFFIIAGQAPAQPQGGSPMFMIVPFAIVGVMLFFLFRAQSKENKRREKMLEEIKTGDKVIIGGGIHGVVANVKEKSFIVKIADNVKVEVNKSGIAGMINNKEDSKQ